MPFNLLITGTFFAERHALSVEAADADAFVAAVRSACGLDGVACSTVGRCLSSRLRSRVPSRCSALDAAGVQSPPVDCAPPPV
jgi:hypothetical protein